MSIVFRTFALKFKTMRMKRLCFSVLMTVLFGLTLDAATPGFTNPILPYDYSDPDVCRVGDTYLMTSSSFNNVPGLQILASTDLVHWQIVDAAIRHQLPGYQPGDHVQGNFVWAPAIREHDGMLYIFYGDPDRGIYCVRANISKGLRFPLDWQDPVLVIAAKGYIDPCPLWDEDGRVYLSHGVAGSRFGLKSVLMLAELNADALSVKVPSRIIFDGHEEHPTSEGTKLYKRNGYYDLIVHDLDSFTVVYSMMGYQTIHQPVKMQRDVLNINVEMATDAEVLEEFEVRAIRHQQG